MAMAFVSDHLWLVMKRDLLKSASVAASLAATMKLSKLNGQTPAPSDADVEAALQDVAENYVRLNVVGNLAGSIRPEDITVTLDIDRGGGTVEVVATAPLGSTLLESIHGHEGFDLLTVRSGAEQAREAVWAVLAIDVSGSMKRELDGSIKTGSTSRRIDTVQEAARDFVDVLGPDAIRNVAIGIVPWARDVGSILSPSTDRNVVMSKIDGLAADGGATRSSVGLRAGRMHLADAPVGTRKALVLLTDGEDNRMAGSGRCHPQSLECLQPRRDQCQAAKDEGIEIFTVTAMLPENVSGTLGQELTACASSPGNAFLNNTDASVLREAFSKIAGKLKPLRLIH